MKHYAITRTDVAGTVFYGPVWGSFYAPDWTPHVFNAQRYSNKRDAAKDARKLRPTHPSNTRFAVVELGTFGDVPNRIIRTVQEV